MKIHTSSDPLAVVFIKMPQQTKKEFMEVLDKLCTDQSKVGRQLIKGWIKKMNKKLSQKYERENNNKTL